METKDRHPDLATFRHFFEAGLTSGDPEENWRNALIDYTNTQDISEVDLPIRVYTKFGFEMKVGQLRLMLVDGDDGQCALGKVPGIGKKVVADTRIALGQYEQWLGIVR